MRIGIMSALMLFLLSCACYAQSQAYFDKVADAIFKAEGGNKAKRPYGIVSVKCSVKEECRRICINTVRNRWKKYEKERPKKTFLKYLQESYAPLNVKNDPLNLNSNWYKNVSYFMGEK